MPLELAAHSSDYLELTGNYIGAGAEHGGGCETLARITLSNDRLIVYTPALFAALDAAEKRGFDKAMERLNMTIQGVLDVTAPATGSIPLEECPQFVRDFHALSAEDQNRALSGLQGIIHDGNVWDGKHIRVHPKQEVKAFREPTKEELSIIRKERAAKRDARRPKRVQVESTSTGIEYMSVEQINIEKARRANALAERRASKGRA